MGRPLRTTFLLAALFVGACNALFDLEQTSVRDEGGGAGASGASGSPGGEGEKGAAGAAGASGRAGASGGEGGAGASGGGGAAGQGGGGEECKVPGALEQHEDCKDNECEGKALRCDKDDKSCEFRCTGKQSCQSAKFECPPDADCRVLCDGVQACQGASVVCGTGSCEVVCRGDSQACQNMLPINCAGTTTCRVACEGPQQSPPGVVSCESRDSACFCGTQCQP